MKNRTIAVSCLQSAFGFLPGLNVGPYGGRGICRNLRKTFVTATGEIPREHELWRRHGLGAREVHELHDVYSGVTTGHLADEIRAHARRGGLIEYFYVADREMETTRELGLKMQHTRNSGAELTVQVGSKIELHATARAIGRPYLVVPSFVCTTGDGLMHAHHALMNVNHTIKAPDCVVIKHAGWASGVGTLITDDDGEIRRYARDNCHHGEPILIEAGYRGIKDVAVQATLTDKGITHVFVNEQVILNGKDHAGNLVVSDDRLPSLSIHDKACLYRRAMMLFRHWWKLGFRGEMGCDAIGIDGKNVDFGEQSDLTPLERKAMQAGKMLDWRFIDPNPRTTASQYPKDVLEQLEQHHGGKWAVLMCNVWPKPGAVENFGQLTRTLRGLLPDDNSGVLPLMTGLLPGKFSIVCMAKETREESAVSKVESLLKEVRNRVGSAS